MLHSSKDAADCSIVLTPTERWLCCLNISNRALFIQWQHPTTESTAVLTFTGLETADTSNLGSVCFKWPLQHLLILYPVLHTLLNLNTTNKKYALKNESLYLFHKF
jgi:hypothetical protein